MEDVAVQADPFSFADCAAFKVAPLAGIEIQYVCVEVDRYPGMVEAHDSILWHFTCLSNRYFSLASQPALTLAGQAWDQYNTMQFSHLDEQQAASVKSDMEQQTHTDIESKLEPMCVQGDAVPACLSQKQRAEGPDAKIDQFTDVPPRRRPCNIKHGNQVAHHQVDFVSCNKFSALTAGEAAKDEHSNSDIGFMPIGQDPTHDMATDDTSRDMPNRSDIRSGSNNIDEFDTALKEHSTIMARCHQEVCEKKATSTEVPQFLDRYGDFGRGQCVCVKDLKARPELNGAPGRLVRFETNAGRWHLQLLSGEGTIKTRPENLVPVAAPGCASNDITDKGAEFELNSTIMAHEVDATMCEACEKCPVVAVHYGIGPYQLCAACSAECPDPLITTLQGNQDADFAHMLPEQQQQSVQDQDASTTKSTTTKLAANSSDAESEVHGRFMDSFNEEDFGGSGHRPSELFPEDFYTDDGEDDDAEDSSDGKSEGEDICGEEDDADDSFDVGSEGEDDNA